MLATYDNENSPWLFDLEREKKEIPSEYWMESNVEYVFQKPRPISEEESWKNYLMVENYKYTAHTALKRKHNTEPKKKMKKEKKQNENEENWEGKKIFSHLHSKWSKTVVDVSIQWTK